MQNPASDILFKNINCLARLHLSILLFFICHCVLLESSAYFLPDDFFKDYNAQNFTLTTQHDL